MARRHPRPPLTLLAALALQASLPAQAESLKLPGLSAPAEILVDRWGVPHLYAQSNDDLFFLQGYNAARDRLFQIDLWRRRGLGRLASIFGPNFVEQDRASRLMLYRGDMAAEWKRYGPSAQRISERFVAGINAFIDQASREPDLLPFEFRYFGYAPEKWQAEDVVRIRSHGLTRNLSSELSRAVMACRGSLAHDEVRNKLSPAWETKLPEGLDPCIPPEVYRSYALATQGVQVAGREDRRGAWDGADEASLQLAAAPLRPPEGSNAWVLAPSKTATGRPMLASDPHRALASPSLRYIVHLNAPGLSVIGAGEPALPGVSIGHNGTIAFGLTIFATDQEDLFVYETRPGKPDEYRYRDGWEKVRRVSESVPVRGGSPEKVELVFTRHGPVLHADPARNRLYALRTAWTEPGTAPYFGSIDYMRARNFEEFRKAMANWGTPSENQLYADTAGNIGWVSGGLAPIRKNWDGLLPVPGDGRYEWGGFWSGEQLPWSYNPKQGWIASSNEQNLPTGYPYQERKLGFEWAANARWQRVAEQLKAKPRLDMEDMKALQNDLLSITARRALAVLREVKLESGTAKTAAALLLAWDARVSGSSPAAALYEVWWSRHLGAVVKDAVLPAATARLLSSADTEFVIDALEQPAKPLGGTAKRDELLDRSLAKAWEEMVRVAGSDAASWRWERLHQVMLPHPLGRAAEPAVQARLSVGPFPKQGGNDTVNISSYDPSSLRQLGGASFRMLIDVGSWDESLAVNTPGQSGNPASPHYRDLAPLWLKGEYFPLLYTRARVEAATGQRIELLPAAAVKPPPKPAASR
ncbi:penicillin acylase family protein [Pelomonas sp. SE-A7]|uniref:penicillin acylase family protein n=1 Tax=Pelomonas sp. SE-A7 TaxID=3054953 RepID=UPI00259C7E7D|nr:penicillin acylase family protein [Pelomonas sp. SE-A7]MDM4764640.1 penicillin acylase family protein [Pelomonas sp. SE-A7]